MGKPLHHTLDIYGTELHLAFDAPAWKKLRRLSDDLDHPRDLGYGCTVDQRETGTDQQHIWIWVGANRHPHEAALLNTIAHEATHAAAFICQRHEVNLGSSHSEPLAYLVGWLAEWMWTNRPANT